MARPPAIANGAQLGWLLDPRDNRATIYRPGHPARLIEQPRVLSGDPVLRGFRFDFRESFKSSATAQGVVIERRHCSHFTVPLPAA
jgi:hypothetical protein